MKPKEIVQKWVEFFNQSDDEGISEFYAENGVYHQTLNGIKLVREI